MATKNVKNQSVNSKVSALKQFVKQTRKQKVYPALLKLFVRSGRKVIKMLLRDI